MTDKKKWAVYVSAVIVLLFVAIAVFNISRAVGPNQMTLADALKRSGYLEIRPAANFDGPGTIVTVDFRTDDYVMLHPTCNMDWTEVSGLWQSSPSVDTDAARALSGEFKLSADFLQGVGLEVGAGAEIDVKLENTRILVLSDESRIGLSSKYLKDNCLQAVKEAISLDKKCVTQPISVMQADVVYRAKLSDSIAASDKAEIRDKMSAALSTKGAANNSDAITGKGLFIGLKLEGWCMVPDNGQPEKSVADLPVNKTSLSTTSFNRPGRPERGPNQN
jgi:hypothetical protein